MATTAEKARTAKAKKKKAKRAVASDLKGWLDSLGDRGVDMILGRKGSGKTMYLQAKWGFRPMSQEALLRESKRQMTMLALKERMQANPMAIVAYAELLDTTAKGLLAMLEQKTPLKPAEAERVLLFDQTMARGLQVFGEQKKFERWLDLRIPALGDQKPVELMKTASGIQQVADELETIAHGVFG